jgi:DNA-binding transcriptional regulator YiaG
MSPDEIRATRERLGLTQTEAAQRLGVSENTWARWERGELGIHPARERDLERLGKGGQPAAGSASDGRPTPAT